MKYIVFSILTFGLYDWYFRYSIARDLNKICDGDGNHTASLLPWLVFTIITCGIYNLVWEFKVADRMADNAQRYGINIREGGSNILLCRVCGVFLCCIGTYVATYIIIRNLNNLSAAYNEKKNEGNSETEEHIQG